MFNTIDNHFNYNINAVSGTVRKSHPKSKFEVAVLSDTRYIFNNEKPRLTKDSEEVVVFTSYAYRRESWFSGVCFKERF